MRLTIDEYRPSRHDGRKEERIAAALEHRYDNQDMIHFKGGYTDILEEELVLARPSHDDVKDALASAVEIAIKPKATHNKHELFNNVVNLNRNRFGGLR